MDDAVWDALRARIGERVGGDVACPLCLKTDVWAGGDVVLTFPVVLHDERPLARTNGHGQVKEKDGAKVLETTAIYCRFCGFTAFLQLASLLGDQ
jgi:hypothetical protein